MYTIVSTSGSVKFLVNNNPKPIKNTKVYTFCKPESKLKELCSMVKKNDPETVVNKEMTTTR